MTNSTTIVEWGIFLFPFPPSSFERKKGVGGEKTEGRGKKEKVDNPSTLFALHDMPPYKRGGEGVMGGEKGVRGKAVSLPPHFPYL